MDLINARAITLLRGPDADLVMQDSAFLNDWLDLYRSCSYATFFQAPQFATAWYVSYREIWEPVLVVSRDSAGALDGLWTLAWNEKEHILVHAGAQQSEYHAWLSPSERHNVFITTAWTVLKQSLPVQRLVFRYLPNQHLAQVLSDALRNVEIRLHRRPLLRLDADQIRSSFAKKSNKSRFNRLKKLGDLEFHRIVDTSELERVMDELIDYYDLRQGMAHNASPFREDIRKRSFHLALFASAKEEVLATVTCLAGRPIAAYWGVISGSQTHLGMLIHTPFLAEHSPGKLHIMQLSEYLVHHGFSTLDLTPGGDLWKERFANEHDEVAEAIIYASSLPYRKAAIVNTLTRATKNALNMVRISPDQARSIVAVLPRATPVAVLRKLRNWIWESREFRIYRGDRTLAQDHEEDARVQRNNLADLLLFEAAEPWQTRQGFLSTALSRLEQAQSVWTIRLEETLAHYGWMTAQRESHMTEVDQKLVFPTGSVAMYDFYTTPSFRGRGFYRSTIRQMLRAAFAHEEVRYAYISVLANNHPSRHVIESLGFVYQGSFYWRRRFGRVIKFSDYFPQET